MSQNHYQDNAYCELLQSTEITTAQHMSSLQPPEHVACVYESQGGNHRSRIWARMSNNFGHVV